MLPNIDATSAVNLAGAANPVKKPEIEPAVFVQPAQRQLSEATATDNSGVAARSATRVRERYAGSVSESDRQKSTSGRDQAEIKMQLTREEREVFINAISGRESPEEMSEEEQSVLQKTSERIDKLIEDATVRDTASRERVDKAVKEWYIRLSNGRQPPGDLLTLIRQAAAGLLK